MLQAVSLVFELGGIAIQKDAYQLRVLVFNIEICINYQFTIDQCLSMCQILYLIRFVNVYMHLVPMCVYIYTCIYMIIVVILLYILHLAFSKQYYIPTVIFEESYCMNCQFELLFFSYIQCAFTLFHFNTGFCLSWFHQ